MTPNVKLVRKRDNTLIRLLFELGIVAVIFLTCYVFAGVVHIFFPAVPVQYAFLFPLIIILLFLIDCFNSDVLNF